MTIDNDNKNYYDNKNYLMIFFIYFYLMNIYVFNVTFKS